MHKKLEDEWKSALPHFTEKELLKMFPSAVSALRRAKRARVKKLKEEINTGIPQFRQAWEKSIQKMVIVEQPEMTQWLNEKCAGLSDMYDKELQRLTYQLNPPKVNQDTNGVTQEQIDQAKQIPLSSLVKINRAKKTKCLWHNDSHPSMHVYKENAYCFVCQKSADSIDVYMQLYGCDFIYAVKQLTL